MPNSIDPEAQARRKKEARRSAWIYTVYMLLSSGMLLLVRQLSGVSGLWDILLLLIGIADLGMIVPVWILLKIRMKEIEGGEEDAASQY